MARTNYAPDAAAHDAAAATASTLFFKAVASTFALVALVFALSAAICAAFTKSTVSALLINIKASSASLFAATAAISIVLAVVFCVSIFRNTHWISDLLGGVAIGTALLLLIIAVDRSIPSRRSNL